MGKPSSTCSATGGDGGGHVGGPDALGGLPVQDPVSSAKGASRGVRGRRDGSEGGTCRERERGRE